jgi:hypothetical protein
MKHMFTTKHGHSPIPRDYTGEMLNIDNLFQWKLHTEMGR